MNKSKSQEEFYEIFTLKNILRPSVIDAYDNNRSGTKDDTGKLINEGTKQEEPDSPDTKVNGLPISEQVKKQEAPKLLEEKPVKLVYEFNLFGNDDK